MDERLLKAMVAAGAVKNINIIASGARFHVEVKTPNGPITAETRKGKVRTWVTLDAAAKGVAREPFQVVQALAYAINGGMPAQWYQKEAAE